MHKVDKLLTRKELGSFSINEKKFKVLEPTIGQRLTQMEEHEAILEKLKEFEAAENFAQVLKTHLTWQKREIEIFFPEMDEKELNSISEEMRVQIFEMLFPASEENESGSKKKESRGGKR